ncbi:MAG: MOSC domain-containing protein [Deltaproteobacteria bacterium]|nr:MOSC domain-containing protein [Deltaproteobacteria bacterium]
MANTTQIELGSVVSLWRYPVKSMMGEELNAAEVTDRGFLGDRAYAIRDPSNGKVVSAKNPRKWAKLIDFRAAFAGSPRAREKIPPVRITLPDGGLVTSEQRDLNKLLTDALGREVTLTATAPETPSLEEYWPDMEGLAHRETVTDEAMPAGTFFDLAVTHVLTTATIDRLRELYPQGRFEVRRFRPNIVVQPASAEKDFLENAWVAHTLVIGDEVRLNVTGPCPRCVMTTLPQGDLPRDPGILRTAAQHNQVNVGVYAAVIRGGTIRRGDPVRLE